jgi:hypothetical protein
MTGTPEGVGVVRTGERFQAAVMCGDRVLVAATWVAQ